MILIKACDISNECRPIMVSFIRMDQSKSEEKNCRYRKVGWIACLRSISTSRTRRRRTRCLWRPSWIGDLHASFPWSWSDRLSWFCSHSRFVLFVHFIIHNIYFIIRNPNSPARLDSASYSSSWSSSYDIHENPQGPSDEANCPDWVHQVCSPSTLWGAEQGWSWSTYS